LTASVFCSHPISDLAALICRVITSIVHLSFATSRTIERLRLYATRMLSKNPSTVLRSRKRFLGQLLGHRANTQGSRARLRGRLIDAGDVGRHPFSAIGPPQLCYARSPWPQLHSRCFPRSPHMLDSTTRLVEPPTFGLIKMQIQTAFRGTYRGCIRKAPGKFEIARAKFISEIDRLGAVKPLFSKPRRMLC